MSPSFPAPVVVAVIPARGGSKGIPGKNVAPVAGVSLVGRAVRACRRSPRVTRVVVSTDAESIASEARRHGAEVVLRPAELASDTASSESALLHALDTVEERHGELTDVLLFVQATSPFLTAEDVEGVVSAVLDGGADSAFTASPFHGFVWRGIREEGAAVVVAAEGVNHDSAERLRRQDRPEEFLETGAAYAMLAQGFRDKNHRFFGNVAAVPVDPTRTLEIDDPTDLERARALAGLVDEPRFPTRAEVDAVVIDFDGTQTDDRVWIDADGHETVVVHRGDGMGISRLRKAGVPVLILSSETNPVVSARARKLDIPVIQGVESKDAELRKWYEAEGIDPQRILYAGNDVNDLPCFELVGWPVAVADAHDIVREQARAVTTSRGGHGVVREIAAHLLGKAL
ncbi:acylneuraminate cytidylyltransferase [Streptomyces sp. NBC_00873]|uniref:cytidylyltransferase domain-containing protein n=1 Tax=unclassified Streptomyces TaxID=2593676 RepID=UPI00386C04AE|nr:acylneuraminate cytidylyltransferase [Streptomyces sp. NBC_00873]WTA46945.1 acylneuraminate cytidylyltransferase [Streptomyces sp. NBC_00842]